MALYQLTTGTGIFRTSDSATIPADLANRDYQEYLAWVAAGNTPDPADGQTKQQKLAALAADYSAQVAQINQLIITAAVVTKDTDMEAYYRTLLDQAKTEYQTGVEAIENG